ncbi:MAG: hypothetical protein H0V30_14475 [Chitinophagaceae bacterium]|jgi:FtsZ-interacting cell division protein ZipA|nr:hypothetical protein [Chitinophagaceae bacterium]
MEVNWYIILIAGVVLLTLLVIIIYYNRRDRKQLEKKINLDYPKPKKKSGEEDPDDLKGT